MNKNEFKKNLGKHVKLRPRAKRLSSQGEPQQPSVDEDDYWIIQGVTDHGVSITNMVHETILGYDHIHKYTSEKPGYGFLTLNVQIYIQGYRLWIEPTLRPGEAIPDR